MRKNLGLTFSFLGTLLMATQTGAVKPDFKDRLEGGVRGGLILFEGDSNLSEGPLVGASLGHYLTDHWMVDWAAMVGMNETDRSPVRDAEIIFGSAELQYHFGKSRLRPYLAAGAGILNVNIENTGQDRENFVIPVGPGVKYQFTDHLLGRVDGRYLPGVGSGDSRNDAYISAGISYLFNRFGPASDTVSQAADTDGDGVLDPDDKCPGTPKGIAVDSNGCPKDSDGDGVNDDKDQCPNTPQGVQVDWEGCPLDADKDGVADEDDKCPNTPIGILVDVDGCSLDSDGDGVNNNDDKCPNTPQGVSVHEDGCPFDTDGDKVYDYLDQCPNTPKGTIVGKDGCKPPKKAEINLDIKFDTNKAEIKPEFGKEIQRVIDFMDTYPTTKAVIEGHTDSVGSRDYNILLSKRRADAVRNYIIQRGIDADRIGTAGFGPDRPIADNATAEGRSKNRRVVATLTADE